MYADLNMWVLLCYHVQQALRKGSVVEKDERVLIAAQQARSVSVGVEDTLHILFQHVHDQHRACLCMVCLLIYRFGRAVFD